MHCRLHAGKTRGQTIRKYHEARPPLEEGMVCFGTIGQSVVHQPCFTEGELVQAFFFFALFLGCVPYFFMLKVTVSFLVPRQLHEQKIYYLASMKKWPDVAVTCERYACDIVQVEGIFRGDLAKYTPCRGVSMATKLRHDHFTKNEQVGYVPLDAVESSEAAVRLPADVVPLYIRSLRLEERYADATKSLDALESIVRTSEQAHELEFSVKYEWIISEREAIQRICSGKDRGDKAFRMGKYREAADQYSACLALNLDTDDKTEGSCGGRLNAILFCNRAACHMALRKDVDAARDCSGALRIQVSSDALLYSGKVNCLLI